MSHIVDAILSVDPVIACVLAFLLIFAEDAIFIGFVIPGETAAVLAGVIASRGNVSLWVVIVVVVAAAIIGDSVGYEVGKHFGRRIMSSKLLKNKQGQLDRAKYFLDQKGAMAVFLGRFTAFFRAVMPALAGSAGMEYRKFVTYNAAGGIVWGTLFVLVGFFAGNSFEAVAKVIGRDVAIVVVGIAIIAFIVWRISKHRAKKNEATVQGMSETDTP